MFHLYSSFTLIYFVLLIGHQLYTLYPPWTVYTPQTIDWLLLLHEILQETAILKYLCYTWLGRSTEINAGCTERCTLYHISDNNGHSKGS